MKTSTMSIQASVADFRAHLASHLRTVKAGGEVLVLDRGTPVARLVPVEADDRTDARMDELVRSGQVRRPSAPLPPSFWERPRPSDPEGRMMQIVLEERAEGV